MFSILGHSLYGAIFPEARTHGSLYQGVEVALLTRTPNKSTCSTFAFIPATLNFASLEIGFFR